MESKISPKEVEKAKELQKIEKDLIKKFKNARQQRIIEEDSKTKEYAPITGAIEKLNQTITHVDEGIQHVLEQNKTLITDVVPFTRSIAEMEIPPSEDETSFEKELYTPAAKSTPFPPKQVRFLDEIEEDTESEGTSSPLELSPSKTTKIGPIPSQYFPITDKHFGISYRNSEFKLGNSKVEIEDNDLEILGKKYKGTKGLWALLTQDYKHLFPSTGRKKFTDEDFKTYKDLLIKTNALYQKNNPATNRPKAPQTEKYKKLLKPIYEEMKNFPVTGKGIVNYNQHSVLYINNLNELISRLNLILASELAGDNNFHNEKVGIIRFLTNLLEKHIDDKKGTEYLIRLVNALPKKIIDDETIGSGLFNKILNKLNFEMHIPGYNYCGPGTRLDERLTRGDKPINKLDEACQSHDIDYRDHKEVSDRHIADKILENRAWERVISKDADIGERSAAYLTTNAMKIKRKLGMGLIENNEFDIFQ